MKNIEQPAIIQTRFIASNTKTTRNTKYVINHISTKKRISAFTLVELIVVITILAIL